MRTDLVLDALRMALTRRQDGADLELVHHSDAGSQYTSFAFQQELNDHRVLQSIGSVGDAYDNAMAESFVDTFKTELIADRVWRTRTQLELAIVEWSPGSTPPDCTPHSATFHPPSSRISTLARATSSLPFDEEREPPNPVSARPSPPHRRLLLREAPLFVWPLRRPFWNCAPAAGLPSRKVLPQRRR
jgi:hypothetical protein